MADQHFIDIPEGWVAVITLVWTAITGASGWIYREKSKEIERLAGRIKELEETIMRLEEEHVKMLKEQLNYARNHRRDNGDP